MPETKQAKSMPVDEAVEIRIWMVGQRLYVLTAYRTPQGTVGYSFARNGHGTPESLAILQSKAPFPGKAVSGWQAEVVAFAAAGLGTIAEVR